jgi:hypothetical protein
MGAPIRNTLAVLFVTILAGDCTAYKFTGRSRSVVDEDVIFVAVIDDGMAFVVEGHHALAST